MTTLQERVVWAFDRRKARDPKATKSALAKAAGVDRASVGDWFNGKTKSLRGEVAIRAAPEVTPHRNTPLTPRSHSRSTPPCIKC